MNKALFAEVTIAVAFIFWFERKRVKKIPGKERTLFVLLLLSAWILTFFDLPNTPGLASVFDGLFGPLRPLVEE
mgnify:CR=1 FL=1